MTLTIEQYHTKKRKGGPAAAAFSGPNGHGKIKTAKAATRRRAGARKTKKA